jgi:short-subunit dehydrogenase
MQSVSGKKVLITGAASGIGKAIALALAREGADLYLLDIDDAKLAAVVREAKQWGGEVAALHCDVAAPEEITAACDTIRSDWGTIDILINNAGVAFYGSTERMTAAQWSRLLAINLLAPIQFTREWLPSLLARPEAHILNVCSIAGLVSCGKLTAYHTSKYGLVGFSEALRSEYSTRGLGVTALCPGFVRTNIFQAAMNGRGSKPLRVPPRWLCSTPEKIAARAVKAIRRNEGLVLISPMSHLLWFLKRLSPGFVAFLARRRSKKKKAQQTAAGPEIRADHVRPLQPTRQPHFQATQRLG